MPYGMRIYDASGNQRLGISDRVFRVLTTVMVGAGTTGSFSVPGFDSTKGCAFAVSYQGHMLRSAHEISTSGTTIYYKEPSNWFAQGIIVSWGPSMIVVVMYG